MKSHKISLLGMFVVAVAATIITFSCAIESYDHEPDPVITNSSEMEDFIIAATDFKQSMRLLQAELNKIDFRTLETVIEDGREVTRLPETVRAIDIEGKLRAVNEAKSALQIAHPKIVSMQPKDLRRHIDRCIRQSARVTDNFLRRGINIYQPTRTSPNEHFAGSYDNEYNLTWDLSNWAFDSDFVEVFVVVFTDGTSTIYHDSRNTATNSWPPTMTDNSSTPNVYYYNGKPISFIAHTHRFSPNPSDKDLIRKAEIQEAMPGLVLKIFWSADFHTF